MNREIKFRVWDKDANSMHEVGIVLIGHGATGYNYPRRAEEAVVGTEDTNRIMMQFTGLKGKNGKEIYEGDLIRHVPDGYEPHPISKVVWSENTLSWMAEFVEERKSGNQDDYLARIGKGYIVIGNIHENPELLKA